nr:DUF1989 domain-containing protein [Rhizobium mesoamericanum]
MLVAYNSKIALSTGDTLGSGKSERLLTIVRDEVGKHDFNGLFVCPSAAVIICTTRSAPLRRQAGCRPLLAALIARTECTFERP